MQSGNWFRNTFIALLFIPAFASGQEKVSAILSTTSKTIRVGEPIHIQLEVTHPASIAVIFPDSTNGFTPFECRKRIPSPTSTVNGISKDAGTYELYSWEIKDVQMLRLPVQYISGKDTLTEFSNTVSFEFNPAIKVWPDSTLKPRAVTGLAEVKEPFNLRAFLILMGILITIITSGAIFLRKPLQRFFRMNKVHREWRKIYSRFSELKSNLSEQEKFIRELNHIWKQYFDNERAFSLTSLTTPELKQVLEKFSQLNPEDKTTLGTASRSAEMILFAGLKYPQSEIEKIYFNIGKVLENEYMRRKEAASR